MSQRLTQSLVLAPQLQQSLALLQAPTLELKALVEQELQQNPVLEEAAPAEGELQEKDDRELETPAEASDPTEPATDLDFDPAAEKNAVQQLKERLPQGEALFTPNAEAGCRFLGMEVDAPILDGQPVQNGHAELSARYRWQCAQPEHLKSVGTTLFADYKRLHKIKAVFAGPRGQHAATLGRKTPTFRW